MTYLEQFRLDHPTLARDNTDEEISADRCVKSWFGIGSIPDCDGDCDSCWKRECKKS